MMKFMLIGLLINSVLQSIPMPASEIVEEIEVINRRQEFKNIFEKIEERKLVQKEITKEELLSKHEAPKSPEEKKADLKKTALGYYFFMKYY